MAQNWYLNDTWMVNPICSIFTYIWMIFRVSMLVNIPAPWSPMEHLGILKDQAICQFVVPHVFHCEASAEIWAVDCAVVALARRPGVFEAANLGVLPALSRFTSHKWRLKKGL